MASSTATARDRLLDAADTLIAQYGYEAVGVAELCRTAEVQKGSFYHYFESKQHLALAHLDRAQEHSQRVLQEAFGDPSRGALESLTAYGRLLASNLEQRRQQCGAIIGCRVGNLAVELSVADEAVRGRVDEVLEEMRTTIEGTIRAGVATGELVADLDAGRAALDIVALMEGLMIMAKARQDADVVLGLGPACQRLLT